MGVPPKLFAFALFTNSEAPLAITVGFPRPGLAITLALGPAKVTEPPKTFKPLPNVFWPLFAKVTAPFEIATRLLKRLGAALLKVRLAAPDLVNEPLAANPPDPPKK